MHCASCVLRNEMILGALPGVKNVEAQLDREDVTITFDPALVAEEQFAAAVAAEGYTLTSR